MRQRSTSHARTLPSRAPLSSFTLPSPIRPATRHVTPPYAPAPLPPPYSHTCAVLSPAPHPPNPNRYCLPPAPRSRSPPPPLCSPPQPIDASHARAHPYTRSRRRCARGGGGRYGRRRPRSRKRPARRSPGRSGPSGVVQSVDETPPLRPDSGNPSQLNDAIQHAASKNNQGQGGWYRSSAHPHGAPRGDDAQVLPRNPPLDCVPGPFLVVVRLGSEGLEDGTAHPTQRIHHRSCV